MWDRWAGVSAMALFKFGSDKSMSPSRDPERIAKIHDARPNANHAQLKVSIPATVRDDLDLAAGDALHFGREEDGTLLVEVMR